MGKCQSQPNGTQPELVYSQTSQPIKAQRISIKFSKDAPSQKFAVPIQYSQIPKLTRQVQARMAKLGPFSYQKCGKFNQGVMLQPYKLKNGSVYVGQWHNGKTNGKGTYYLPDNSVFEGISVQNQIQGYGRIIHANGDYYEGQVKDSRANGEGTYVQGDITYKGRFKNNLQSGEGVQYSNLYEFKGTFWQGQKQKGTLIIKNQQKYEYTGEFKNNKYNGYGVLINDIGKYEGQFLKGKKHGYGKFTWADGSYYEGEYKQDKKQGDGRLFNKKGTIIREGNWKDNVIID